MAKKAGFESKLSVFWTALPPFFIIVCIFLLVVYWVQKDTKIMVDGLKASVDKFSESSTNEFRDSATEDKDQMARMYRDSMKQSGTALLSQAVFSVKPAFLENSYNGLRDFIFFNQCYFLTYTLIIDRNRKLNDIPTICSGGWFDANDR